MFKLIPNLWGDNMRILVSIEEELISFEINEVGILGIAEIYKYKSSPPLLVKPSKTDIKEWLKKGKVLDIQFRNEAEMKSLILHLLKLK